MPNTLQTSEMRFTDARPPSGRELDGAPLQGLKTLATSVRPTGEDPDGEFGAFLQQAW